MPGFLKQIQRSKRQRAEESAIPAAVLDTSELERVLPQISDDDSERKLEIVKKRSGAATESPWEFSERRLSDSAEQLLTVVTARLLTLDTALPLTEEIIRQTIVEVDGSERIQRKEHETVAREVLLLLSPLELLRPFLDDLEISEIFLDNHRSVKLLRSGQLLESPFSFRSVDEFKLFLRGMHVSERALNDLTVTRSTLAGGLQVSVLHPAILCGEEPRAAIKIPRKRKASFYDLLQGKVLPATVAAWLAEVIAQGEANLLVLGPSRSGKTFLTSALLSEISSAERVTTIEESPEFLGSAINVEQLVSRPADDGRAVTMSDLYQIALERSARRLIVSELKNEEARHFLHALEVGFSGCVASAYGEFAEDGLWRLLDLITRYEAVPERSLVRRISRSIHLIAVMTLIDGKPCLTELSEVIPSITPEFSVVPLVRFEGSEEGKRMWRLLTDRSYWQERVASKGVSLRVGPALLPPEGRR